MQGFVFCEFQEFVQKSYSFETWDLVAAKIGIDTSKYSLFKNYPTDEFERLVTALSLIVSVPYQEILEKFGAFTTPKLWRVCSRMIPSKWTLPDVLENLASFSNTLMANAITGVEAKTTLNCTRTADNEVTICYHSPRKLCNFGKGIIKTLAKQYGSEVQIEEPKCLLRGDKECQLICRTNKN